MVSARRRRAEGIANAIHELADAVNNTIIAVNSDALAAALEVYASCKQHCNKVPGLNVLVDEMGEFFKKSKNRGPAAGAQAYVKSTPFRPPFPK